MATHDREHLDRALALFERAKVQATDAAPPVASAPPAAPPEAGGD